MATGLHSDAILRPEYLEAGFIEGYGQNLNAFNGASGGALRLISAEQEGYYAQERFFDAFASTVISRRDLTSTSAATGIKPTLDENIAVKLFRTAGPIDATHGMFRTMGMSPEAFSLMLGQRLAQRAIQGMLNDALTAAVAALDNTSAVKYDYSGTADLDFTAINSGFGKFGDARNDIAAVVMHSQGFNALVADGLSNYKIDTVAGMTIVQGAAEVALGKPIVLTDSSALVNTDGVTSGTDSYYALGLVPGAVTVVESEGREFVEYFLDRDQITKRIHGELAWNVGVKGYKWDTSNGGSNPNAATLATGSNWDQVVADKRDLAGVIIEHQ